MSEPRTKDGRLMRAGWMRALTIQDVAEAVCISEVAGSGHGSGDVPCDYHNAESVKVQRLFRSLIDPDRLLHYNADRGGA